MWLGYMEGGGLGLRFDFGHNKGWCVGLLLNLSKCAGCELPRTNIRFHTVIHTPLPASCHGGSGPDRRAGGSVVAFYAMYDA